MGEIVIFYVEVHNKLGVFESIRFNQPKEKYIEFLEVISNFHIEEKWEMELESGGKFLMGKKLVEESIFIVRLGVKSK